MISHVMSDIPIPMQVPEPEERPGWEYDPETSGWVMVEEPDDPSS